jgi:DNA-binding winged helix-turn-helix (wHTH) protein
MNTPKDFSRIVRFGVFELDLQARELRKRGLRMRLEEKPLQILQLLLERPGELVTRNLLRE